MKTVNITDVCDIQVGKTPSRANLSYWGEGALWLSIADMNQGVVLKNTKETITEKAIKECNCKIIPDNTVLFSFKLSIGKVGITGVPMYTNEAIAAFPIKNGSKLDTKYLYYALRSADHSIGSNKAVMGKTLNKEQLKKINIPLPPIEDQKHIVKLLDQADSLREKRKQSSGLLNDYLKSVTTVPTLIFDDSLTFQNSVEFNV
jgi:type I restriction enzyme S subunit